MAIAFAEIKKVHAKSQGCFKINQKIDLVHQSISNNSTMEFPFEFKLDENLTVSDKKGSFHLLYGNMENPFHLQIAIVPQPIFLELIKLFDTFFRFKLKEYKGTTKGLDFILTPPSSREYAQVESLNLSFQMLEQSLKLDFTFNLKKLDLLAATQGQANKIIKDTKIISKVLNPKDYMMGKVHLDQDKLLKIFEEILKEVKTRQG